MSQIALESATVNYVVTDVPTTSRFYQRLGFAEVATVPTPDGTGLQWAMLVQGGATVMLQDAPSLAAGGFAAQAKPATGLVVFIKLTEGLEAQLARVETAGIPLAQALHESFYGTREFAVLDPDGVIVVFAQDV